MHNNEEQELKKEFQLERVILFSDAVFAIIITIMVLDIRLPEGIRNANREELSHAFKELIPKVVAYGVSFFLVAKFWQSHLKMFSLLKDYDTKLLRYNLLYLFSVSLFPFAVSLISGNVGIKTIEYGWAAYIYVGIIMLTILTQTLLSQYLMNNKERLCYNTDNLDRVLKYKILRLNFYLVPAIVIAMLALIYFVFPPYFIMYILSLYGIIMSRFYKKYYPEKESNQPVLSRLFSYRKNRLIKKTENTERIDPES